MPSSTQLTLDTIHSWLPPRPHDAHKGLFGHILILGGDEGMPGAVRLTGEGALRVGAGLVTVVTRKAHVLSTINGRPELLCYGLDTNLSLLDKLLTKASLVVLGPGLGQSTWSKRLVDCTLATTLPLLIDADGLNWLARIKNPSPHRTNWVLTPHPGEAARLLGITTQEVQADRLHAINTLQQQYGGVIVLKGDTTLVSCANEPLYHNQTGNPGMASPGMGDLLSGMIAGLIGQGLTLWQAACAGVLLHGQAGDCVAKKLGERGLLASDLLLELPRLVN